MSPLRLTLFLTILITHFASFLQAAKPLRLASEVTCRHASYCPSTLYCILQYIIIFMLHFNVNLYLLPDPEFYIA